MLILSNSAAAGRTRGGVLSDALVGVALLVMTVSAVVFLVTTIGS
jgi:hypothetical protein